MISWSILTACLCYQGHCAAEAGIEGVARHKEARFAQGEFYKDAAAGTLPAFSFVSPFCAARFNFTRDSTLATCKDSLTNKTSFERALSHPNSPTLPLPDPGARERHQNPAVSTRLRSAHAPFACIRGVYNTLGAFSKHSLRAEAQIYLFHPIHTVRWHWEVSSRHLNHFSVEKYCVCSLRYYPRCNFSLPIWAQRKRMFRRRMLLLTTLHNLAALASSRLAVHCVWAR